MSLPPAPLEPSPGEPTPSEPRWVAWWFPRQRVEPGTSPGHTDGSVPGASLLGLPRGAESRIRPQSPWSPVTGPTHPRRRGALGPACWGHSLRTPLCAPVPWLQHGGVAWTWVEATPHGSGAGPQLPPLERGPLNPVPRVSVDELAEGRTQETVLAVPALPWGRPPGPGGRETPSAQPDVLAGHPGHRAGVGAEVGARRRG